MQQTVGFLASILIVNDGELFWVFWVFWGVEMKEMETEITDAEMERLRERLRWK